MTQRWKVGDATITSVLEDEIAHIPPEFFFPDATASDVARYPELVPEFADEQGNITLRVQGVVVETEDVTRVPEDLRCLGFGERSGRCHANMGLSLGQEDRYGRLAAHVDNARQFPFGCVEGKWR